MGVEVVGAGKEKGGAVWVSRRVPDEHIFVAANGSRIREIQTDNPDYFMYSKNIFDVAKKLDLWNPEDGSLEFCYAYASRKSLAARRREWRVFDLVAPSLKLDPDSENYAFSGKPENWSRCRRWLKYFQIITKTHHLIL